MRVVFLGTPEFAVPTLEALIAAGHQLAAIYTQPDRPKGRGNQLSQSPVNEAAAQHGLLVLQPERIRRPENTAALSELKPDVMVVVGYGQIIPQSIIDIPKHGILNVHASLLPKYRGAAPIQWAIADGEPETGVTIMQMDAGLDTGPILSMRRTPILPEDDSQKLHDRLARLGAELLVETIPGYVAGEIQPQPQPAEGSTYAAKIKKEDGRIDWNSPAEKIWNRLRAFTPWPGAYTFLQAELKPQLLKIWQAGVVEQNGEAGTVLSADKTGVVVACGQNALRI